MHTDTLVKLLLTMWNIGGCDLIVDVRFQFFDALQANQRLFVSRSEHDWLLLFILNFIIDIIVKAIFLLLSLFILKQANGPLNLLAYFQIVLNIIDNLWRLRLIHINFLFHSLISDKQEVEDRWDNDKHNWDSYAKYYQ